MKNIIFMADQEKIWVDPTKLNKMLDHIKLAGQVRKNLLSNEKLELEPEQIENQVNKLLLNIFGNDRNN